MEIVFDNKLDYYQKFLLKFIRDNFSDFSLSVVVQAENLKGDQLCSMKNHFLPHLQLQLQPISFTFYILQKNSRKIITQLSKSKIFNLVYYWENQQSQIYHLGGTIFVVAIRKYNSPTEALYCIVNYHICRVNNIFCP